MNALRTFATTAAQTHTVDTPVRAMKVSKNKSKIMEKQSAKVNV